MGESTPLEKIFTRMLPLIIVGAYCLQRKYRSRLRNLFRPAMMPLWWYIAFGTIGGFTGIQPSLTMWKAAEITIALMWMAVSCHNVDAARSEFVAFSRCVETLLGITVVLAFARPSMGFIPSASIIPWIRGYYPIINPNALGFMSVYALIRLLFLPAKYKIPRMMLVAFTLLCAQSRTSYAVTGLILLVFVFEGIRNRQLMRVFLAMVFGLFAMCLAIGWFDTLVKIFMRGQDAESFGSLSGRTNYWEFALTQVRWIGGGLATGARSLIFVSSDVFYKGMVAIHNSYIEALVDAGYIGAIPFIAGLAIYFLRQVFKTFREPSEFNFIYLCFGCVFFARGMTSMVLALFSFDFVMLTFFIGWQMISTKSPAAPLPRPKPVTYEKTLHEQSCEKITIQPQV